MSLIPPVGGGMSSFQPITAPTATSAATPTETTASGDSFGSKVADALDTLQTGEQKVDGLAQKAASGKLQNVEDFLIAATENQLNMQLTVAVRNKAVESFNEIMRMQV